MFSLTLLQINQLIQILQFICFLSRLFLSSNRFLIQKIIKKLSINHDSKFLFETVIAYVV